MEERRRNIGLDDFAQVLREASKARSEILRGAARLRRAMHAKLDELRLRENEAARLADILAARKKRRKPPEAGLDVPAAPPKGPLPMQGGAEAPLDFED
jgi:hypothetical protein